MALRIMITGPHGIGKTDTAIKLSNQSRPPLIHMPSMAGQIAKEMNYDLNNNPTPLERIAYQEALLKALVFQYKCVEKTHVIFDRSPIDLMAYLALSIKDEDMTKEITERLDAYGEACREATEKYCDVLILPEADYSAAYDKKDNRPDFSEEQVKFRAEYALFSKMLASMLTRKVKVLVVPGQYQFDERVEYIVKTMNAARGIR